MIRARSIQSKLFLNYSLLILGVVAVFAVSFYFYISKIIETRASQSLFQISGHISSGFDAQLKAMNDTSTKILFSKSLSSLFFSDIFHVNLSTISARRQFNDILYSIIGFQRDFQQINLFRISGEFAGFGDNSVYTVFPSGRMDDASWVRATLDNRGARLIALPHKDDWGTSDKTVISLNRAFSENWEKPDDSILEIQQDYAVFAQIVRNSLVQPDNRVSSELNVYVFDKNGELVYPLERDAMAAAYWERIRGAEAGFLPPVRTVRNPYTKGEDILAYSRSDFSEWTVAASVSRSLLFRPVATFRNVLIGLSLSALAVTLFISYIVSKTLTTPIKKIHKSIKFLSLSAPSAAVEAPFTSKLNELEQLSLSFHEMRSRLQESVEEAIASRSHEIEARAFALQAQMNPHFLHNTLANVSTMAEERDQPAIAEVCMSLSGMLRYISSDHAVPVTLGQELEHTRNYFKLMQLRYEENVSFRLDVPERLLAIRVPKLIVQPLAENSMKYAVNVDPPWIVSIQGHDYPDRWELTIRDNGDGFAPHRLARIRERLAATNPSERKPDLHIGGMGLLNIYIRLKLLFGSRASFDVGNAAEGGAQVTIAVRYD